MGKMIDIFIKECIDACVMTKLEKNQPLFHMMDMMKRNEGLQNSNEIKDAKRMH